MYDEVVDLAASIDVQGGFDSEWTFDTHADPAHQVRIVGAWDPVESKFLAVKARDLGQETTLHNVIVDGTDADGADGG